MLKMDQSIEKQCSMFEELFQQAVSDLKASLPIWEDFSSKGMRLHGALKTVMTCMSAFLESFQKVADMASGTRGSNKEIGSALTRLCLRHRSIESKMKTFTSSLMENMITPLQDHLEDWKKAVVYMDREHKQENKKAQHEFRRANSEASKLQKKLKKGKSEISESAIREANDKLIQMREVHLASAKGMLIEERARFCYFISCLKPFMEQEINLLSEVTHLQEIIDNLNQLSSDPNSLSTTGQQMIRDMVGSGGPLPIAPQHSNLSASSSNIDTSDNQRQHDTTNLESSSYSSLHSNTHSNVFERSFSQPSKDRNSDIQEQLNGSYNSLSLNKSSSQQRWSQRVNEPMPIEMEMVNDRGGQLNADQLHHQQLHKIQEQMMRVNMQSSSMRPHTISAAFERSLPQRTPLSPATFIDQQKIYSSTRSIAHPSDYGNKSGGYAVPCTTGLNIKRQSSYGSDTKVADIYARPSLAQSKGGYRVPNIKPVPVATPTVPELSTSTPQFPVTGYVNMNQLANMAMQQHPLNDAAVKQQVQRQIQQQHQQLQQQHNLQHSDATMKQQFLQQQYLHQPTQHSDTLMQQLSNEGSFQNFPMSENLQQRTEFTRESYNDAHPINESKDVINGKANNDMHDLASRLARAYEVNCASKYCTLPRRISERKEVSTYLPTFFTSFGLMSSSADVNNTPTANIQRSTDSNQYSYSDKYSKYMSR